MSSTSSSSLNLQSRFQLNNGHSIPKLGLGTWRSDKGLVEEAVKIAIGLGVQHIDCAFVYGNEKEVGAGIKKGLAENSSLKRSDLFITSKLWNTNHAPANVEKQVKQSLSDLQLEYLDLLLIHWPISWTPESTFENHKWENVPIKDTWQAMEELVKKGLVKSIGVSNFTIEEVKEVLSFASIKPAVNQVESHPYLNQQELRNYLQSEKIILTAYSPLGNINPKEAETSPLSDPLIKELATKYKKSPAQILIRWALQVDHNVIPKSTTPSRIKENIEVFDFDLSKEDVDKINQLGSSKHKRFVNPKFKEGDKQVFAQ